MAIVASTRTRTATRVARFSAAEAAAAHELMLDGLGASDGEVYPPHKDERRPQYNAYLAGWALRNALIDNNLLTKEQIMIRTYQEDDGFSFSLFIR